MKMKRKFKLTLKILEKNSAKILKYLLRFFINQLTSVLKK